MENFKILWIDDEVDLLKPHILFLQERGFKISTSTNGSDALKMIQEEVFHIIFLAPPPIVMILLGSSTPRLFNFCQPLASILANPSSKACK